MLNMGMSFTHSRKVTCNFKDGSPAELVYFEDMLQNLSKKGKLFYDEIFEIYKKRQIPLYFMKFEEMVEQPGKVLRELF